MRRKKGKGIRDKAIKWVINLAKTVVEILLLLAIFTLLFGALAVWVKFFV